MSMKQLVQTRNDLRSALAHVQAMIDTQVRTDSQARADKRKASKARNPKVPVNPTRDPRVAAIREVVYDYLGNSTQVFNNRRKDGSRSVKVWYAMSEGQIDALMVRIDAVVTNKVYELVKTRYAQKAKHYLRVVLPAAE